MACRIQAESASFTLSRGMAPMIALPRRRMCAPSWRCRFSQ
jgi:hypothetical protein